MNYEYQYAVPVIRFTVQVPYRLSTEVVGLSLCAIFIAPSRSEAKPEIHQKISRHGDTDRTLLLYEYRYVRIALMVRY